MKVYLRPPHTSDVDILFEWENNPDNWEVSDTKDAFIKKQIEDFVQSTHDIYINQQYRFMICLEQTDEAIGCIDLFEFNEQQKRVGVGILIGNEKERKKGFARQSLQLLVDYCKNQLKVRCVFCHIFKENTNSIRLFEKCGFRFIEERELFGKPVNYYELKL
ncbi:MAG: GNAT family N-acetyltransferase [Flavobacteriales bacterium]|nr:GNAT family N-acetyltransferase [Flavobacteriales bacterium]MCB9336414.1 GNAT family N-acetyltransferase [Flavobacteriales bacterium]